METTAGQLLINSLLPADLRDYDRVLTKSELGNLLKDVAKKYPERYEQIVSGMTRLGGKIVRRTGGLSFGLDDLAPTPSVLESRLKVKAEVRKILTDPDRTPGQKRTAIADFLNSQQKSLEDSVYKESLDEQSPLAHQVLSGARGSKTNLKTLRAGDLLYVDNRERPIPIPIDRSYSEGLRPAQYFAATYGARKGVLDNKLATADSGFFSKQLNQAVHRLLVTGRDEDEDDRLDQNEVRPIRGLPVDTDDPDNEGALLAQDFGPYKRNTPITPKIAAHLKDSGYDKILVRSPMATNNPDGVYSRDVGIREDGHLARRGQFGGLLAASSLAEPLTQGMLCLAAGTMVRMAHGGSKPIEKIKFGNYVLGCDKNGRTFPVKVIGTFDNGPRECLRTQFHNVQTNERVEVICTAEHKILAEYRVKADEQTVGPCQIHISKEAEIFWALLPKTGGLAERTCQKNMGVFPTYDIEVDHPDHLFVLENGLAVANSSKHSGGVAGQAKSVGGFQLINQLAQAPKKFPGGATHSQRDGKVRAIQPAPQGGLYVFVDDEKHYIPQGFTPQVKIGDEIEAGDQLSDGLPHPGELVKFKGVGEGRRVWMQQFRQAYKDSGLKANRRNVEMVARGIVNHVRMTEEHGRWVPDDVVPYNVMERSWTPQEGSTEQAPQAAIGSYLQRPILHYTIGTQVRPSVVKTLQQFKIPKITTHKTPPPFQPEMVRAMENMSHDEDWMTRMLGSYQQRSLLESVHRGLSSDPKGTSFVPALANPKDFGRQGYTASVMDDDDDYDD